MAYPKMNVKRLKEFRKLMVATRKEEVKGLNARLFDMGNWFKAQIGLPSVSVDPKTGACEMTSEEPMCRTQQCAFGTCALHYAFQKEGLKLTMEETENDNGTKTFIGTVNYRGDIDMEAGSSFFGLTEKEAAYLFMPNHYKSKSDPKEVVQHIDKVLAGGFRK